MKDFIGEIVVVNITAKVAEKDKSGKLTGKMIGFKEGDVGKIAGVRGKGRERAFFVSLAKGTVLLRGDVLDFPEDDEIRIPTAVLHKSHPDYLIREEDRDEGAQY
jgi:hypothetical protein